MSKYEDCALQLDAAAVREDARWHLLPVKGPRGKRAAQPGRRRGLLRGRARADDGGNPLHFEMRLLRFLAASLLVAALGACSAGARDSTIPPGAGIQSYFENGAGGRYVAPVTAGSTQPLARGSRVGTVLTDTNCTPDARGLSHCHNSIAFADGSRIAIVDNHQMSRHRCLRPGERVRVSLLEGRWVTLQTGI